MIEKLQEELERVRNEVSEKEKELAQLRRRERSLSQKLEGAWEAQYDKIVAAIKGLV
jgi:predicted  nucleic acid-binding Zn-ribbon protein